jgi:hypothetical protein
MIGDISPKVTAGAGIHTGDQHELRGKSEAGAGPGNGHNPIFQGLTQHFQHSALELGQFIQKQHSPV